VAGLGAGKLTHGEGGAAEEAEYGTAAVAVPLALPAGNGNGNGNGNENDNGNGNGNGNGNDSVTNVDNTVDNTVNNTNPTTTTATATATTAPPNKAASKSTRQPPSSSSSSSSSSSYGPVSYTGTNRLPHSLDYQQLQAERSGDCTSRCVYNYEDKYRFSRILSQDTLIFSSHFESGNLLSVNRITLDESNKANLPSISMPSTPQPNQIYDMTLHPDISSLGHNQWFYYSVSNTHRGSVVKFNITNLGKPDSLYNKGLKILLFSQHDGANGVG
jgi:hypothetical protein